MKKKKIYLDTSIFIAEFDKKGTRHKILTKFLKQVEKVKDVEFCYSKWALTEVHNRLTKDKIEELKIVKYIKDLLDKNRLRRFKLKQIDVSPRSDYNFNDFFHDLAKDLIRYKTGKDRPGLGDIIHIRIMKNNRIKTIITFDADFENIAGFTTINLLKIKVNNKNANNNNSKK